MKTHLAILSSFALVIAAAQTFAQQPPPPQISVSGSAEIKVAPDEIYLRLGVETRNENLDEAKRQNDERISRALAFFKSSDIKSKDVQTDFISVEPTYDNNMSRTKPVGYIVRKSIEVKLTKTDAFESILTGVLANGVNTVHGIEFRTSELRKHRDKARSMAIQAAREKADALAADLGVKRGNVYNISANEWGGWWSSGASYWGERFGGAYQNAVQNSAPASEGDNAALSLGQISVSASVNVSFLIAE